MLETLDYAIRIGITPTILYFYSAYAAHYVYFSEDNWDSEIRPLHTLTHTQRANARNVRLYYPHQHYTNLLYTPLYISCLLTITYMISIYLWVIRESKYHYSVKYNILVYTNDINRQQLIPILLIDAGNW